MRKQTDPTTGRRLNIPGKFLVGPPELESTLRVIAAADRVEGGTENLEVVIEAALSDGANGPTAWYLVADPQRFDTFDVGLVNESGPIIETKPGFDIDGMLSKVRIDFGIAALDFRGVYRNKGA